MYVENTKPDERPVSRLKSENTNNTMVEFEDDVADVDDDVGDQMIEAFEHFKEVTDDAW